MIAIVNQADKLETTTWQEEFLRMMPTIEKHARVAFRGLDADKKEDAVSEVVASAMCACRRLHERGELKRIFASALAKYAIKQYRVGRRVGARTNTLDVISPAAQSKHGIKLCSLSEQEPESEDWKLVAIEDRSSTPADIAAFRIDFENWTTSLQPRYRRIAADLGIGHSTSIVARKHRVSRGRVSQIRRELESSWSEFQTPSSTKASPLQAA